MPVAKRRVLSAALVWRGGGNGLMYSNHSSMVRLPDWRIGQPIESAATVPFVLCRTIESCTNCFQTQSLEVRKVHVKLPCRKCQSSQAIEQPMMRGDETYSSVSSTISYICLSNDVLPP